MLNPLKVILAIGLMLFVIAPVVSADCYQLLKQPAVNLISLVIDRSGSMKGQPLAQAKMGAKAFIQQMWADDRASVIEFGSQVNLVTSTTRSKADLQNAIGQLKAEGATALYDAIARATLLLAHQTGAKIVVFLTDGSDNSSRYTLSDLQKMNVSEGVFIYGIGLGRVDEEKLRKLATATGGTLELTRDSTELKDLYLRVLEQYYQKYGNRQAETGTLLVKSIPDNQQVVLDGRKVGRTPYKLNAVTAGDYQVGIIYDRGIWECQAVVQNGYRTLIDSRQSDLGADLLIVSSPQGASVFIDDAYVGLTAVGKPISLAKADWFKKAQADGRQLRVRKVPYGNIQLRLRGIPDFDFGPDQEIEVEIPIKDEQMVLFADIFRQKVVDQQGKVYAVGRPNDPFQELEDAVGNQ